MTDELLNDALVPSPWGLVSSGVVAIARRRPSPAPGSVVTASITSTNYAVLELGLNFNHGFQAPFAELVLFSFQPCPLRLPGAGVDIFAVKLCATRSSPKIGPSDFVPLYPVIVTDLGIAARLGLL